VILSGNNLASLHQLASKIRNSRKPNFFTGVGIRYAKDIVPNRQKKKELWRKKSKNQKFAPSHVVVKYKK